MAVALRNFSLLELRKLPRAPSRGRTRRLHRGRDGPPGGQNPSNSKTATPHVGISRGEGPRGSPLSLPRRRSAAKWRKPAVPSAREGCDQAGAPRRLRGKWGAPSADGPPSGHLTVRGQADREGSGRAPGTDRGSLPPTVAPHSRWGWGWGLRGCQGESLVTARTPRRTAALRCSSRAPRSAGTKIEFERI